MAGIDKRMTPFDVEVEDTDEVEVTLGEEIDFDEVGEEEDEDGNVIIDFDPEADKAEAGLEHDANLAEFMDDTDLTKVGTELVKMYKDDRESRKPWEKAYTKGIKLLGLEIEERSQPWSGASGVFHPILSEAVIKFQAEAMTETFPAAGPVLTKLIGKSTPEKEKQAKRVRHDMNYQCTEVMTEYRNEHEQALFHLPIAGSVFKKVYYDRSFGRQTSQFVTADDFIVAYGTTDLKTCPRSTHVMKLPKNDLKKAQRSGMYRDVEVPEPAVVYTDIEKREAKASGDDPKAEKDDNYTFLEMHVEYDMPGFEELDEFDEPTEIALPYVVTIDLQSQIVLSVYRNWDEDDTEVDKTKNDFFIHYPFLPGLGFYGIGLVHLLGGIAKASTSILRQLIDAGTLANLPAGLKTRGLRIKGDNSPLRPGEFRDVDVPGGSIKDNISFIPYKEPSTVLYTLLGTLVEEGRNLSSIADIKISDMSSQAPVGTTLAILERGMKVMSGVNARIHAAMKQEFKLLAQLVKAHAPDAYEYEVDDETATRGKDYDDRVDVCPVSNPNASTMAHRIMRHQAIHQLSLTAPDIYDTKLLHRSMIEAMGEDNFEKIIPMDEDMKPMDPVAENMAILTGQPVKAHIHQDHESHIKVHMAMSEDPKLMEMISKSPAAQVIAGAGAAHLQEHVAFAYRREIERQLGVPLPDYDEDLPAETEVQLSKLIADAADKLLKKDVAEAQALKNAEAQNDPVLQMQLQDSKTKAAEVERKGFADKLRAFLGKEQIASKEKLHQMDVVEDRSKEAQDQEIELLRLKIELIRLQSQDEQAGARLDVDVALGLADDDIERQRIETQSAQATQREEVNLRRNDQSADLEAERLENERNRDKQNMAGRFMDVFRGKANEAQKVNKDE